jgi:DNA-binding IclR family transcriptional regulator
MLIQFGPNGLYDLGPMARRLGLVAMGRLDAFGIASKYLLKLRDETGHTACLTIWGESGPVLVRWENGASPLLVNVRVGSSLPLLESAIGRLFLAHLPPLVTQPVVKRQQQMAAPETRAVSISDAELDAVRAVRSLHFASALIAGVDAIAASVFDAQGSLSSVICLLASHHEQKVGPQVAFGEATPVIVTHSQAMLTEADGSLSPEIRASKTYSSVSASNSACLRAVR